MNVRALFPTPVAYFPNFITSKERLEIFKSIKNISHYPHGAIDGDGLSTHQHPSKAPKFLNRDIKLRIQDAINEYSKETIVMEEGCLSFPKQFAEIERPQSIQLQYTNEKNKIIREEKNGYEARVLQHEIDHLSGKLFVDYLSSLKRNMIMKKVQKLIKSGKM